MMRVVSDDETRARQTATNRALYDELARAQQDFPDITIAIDLRKLEESGLAPYDYFFVRATIHQSINRLIPIEWRIAR